MRLAISNIAWDVAEDEFIVQLLNSYEIDAIDVAPMKYFPDPFNATNNDIRRVRNWWGERGIEITGMQALLFDSIGLNVFGSEEVQNNMLKHLTEICRIAAGLGATRLVFGSPKNRDCSGLTAKESIRIAVPFFKRLGEIALSSGVLICLEPTPLCYGANFMITSAETARVVELVAHPAIKMQLDTGALTINREDTATELDSYSHLVGHVHASEPDLLTLGDGGVNHGKVYTALMQYLPNQLVSIEMLATNNEHHSVSIERALNVAIQNYRPDKSCVLL